jgi:hypothetical protein
MSFDIIGDVHGHADALKVLLRNLDMKSETGPGDMARVAA